MRNFTLSLMLTLAWLTPQAARGQSVEEDNRERTKSPAAARAKGDNSPDLAEVVKLVVARTNEFRKAEGRPEVKVNQELTATARYFADYMARTGEYGHRADGRRPADRAEKHGYEYCLISENIAYVFDPAGFTTEGLAGKFVTGWKESPGHRENMLDPDVTETGVAVAQSDETGYYYAVQMFGRPQADRIEFEIANESPEEVSYTIGDRTFTLPPRYTRTHSQCRPPEVTMDWPGEQEPATVRPANGDRYTIVRENGEFRLRAKK
jgi:uncharacterized protein YkwD